MNSISHKVFMIVLSAILGMLLLAGVIYWQGTKLKTASKEMSATLGASYSALEHTSEVLGVLQDLLRMRDPDLIEKALEVHKTESGHLKRHVSTLGSGEVEALSSKFLGAGDKVIEAVLKGDISTGLDHMREEASPAYSELLKALSAKNIQLEAEANERVESIVKSSNMAGFLLAAVAALALALGAVAFSTKSIVRPIQSVTNSLKEIATGDADLTARLPITSKDEVGQLATWFNTFVDQIAKMVSEIKTNADRIDNSSGSLAAIASDMAHGAQSLASTSHDAAASTKGIKEVIEDVSEESRTATANLNSMAAALEEMSSTITEIARNSEEARNVTSKAVAEVGGASSQVARLGVEAQEISKVTDTIKGISEQTKLLALNATIEAARAGEAGKGFAVVAGEIKELARQTADSTGDIAGRVQSIQSAVSETVGAIQQTVTVINEVNQIVASISAAVEEQSITVRELSGNVNQVFSDVSDVNMKVGRTADSAEVVAESVSNVDATSQRMLEGSSNLEGRAKELSDYAATLQGLVNRFKV